jgi:hypothetical protein
LETRRAVLEAAHLVYYEFWGKPLDELLHSVTDCGGNFKYFTEEQINTLRLRDLLYTGDALLVRDEYEVSYKALCSYKEDSLIWGVVVTGQPGIGMHLADRGLLR